MKIVGAQHCSGVGENSMPTMMGGDGDWRADWRGGDGHWHRRERNTGSGPVAVDVGRGATGTGHRHRQQAVRRQRRRARGVRVATMGTSGGKRENW